MGLDYVAVQCDHADPISTTRVSWAGRFSDNAEPRPLAAAPALDGVRLRALAGGAFHCCAVSEAGELYTFGDEFGPDESNGNLLGHGRRATQRDGGGGGGGDGGGDARFVRQRADGVHVPRDPRLVADLPPLRAVACSTYATLALAVDGRCFSWGDCDGNALGHAAARPPVDAPRLLASLRGADAVAGALSYTNGAVASKDGHVYCWGGNAWEGGICNDRASDADADVVARVAWSGVPPCYACKNVALGHNHGFLLFEMRP